MKSVLMAVLTLCTASAFANDKPLVYKDWKTFRSDYGYEFKYPSCWELVEESYDEPAPIMSSTKLFAVKPGNTCKDGSVLASNNSKTVIFDSWTKAKSKEETRKEIELREKNAKSQILRRDILYFKRFNVEGSDAIVSVDYVHSAEEESIKWEMDLYCPHFIVRVVGPSLKNPNKTFYEAFKAGHVSTPEPEKAIYESIRCIDPKLKK
jgi:hypothetical protein